MMCPGEPFMQTLMQNHISTSTRNNAFVISTSEELLRKQSIAISAELALQFGSMTPREMEILELLGKGLSMKGSARELDIAVGTVKWHIRNIYQKLDASSRDEVLAKARQQQLIR
mgnify:CR=1 FL=1